MVCVVNTTTATSAAAAAAAAATPHVTTNPANKSWRDEKRVVEPNYFERLGRQHTPRYLWIGCADARVPANEIIGEVGSVSQQYPVHYTSLPRVQ